RRLVARQTEMAGEIADRLRIADEQAQHKGAFDHVVVNEDVNRAVHALLTTMERELQG
ncbi:MAG: hypothetical protein JHC83_10650, partial [Thermoleophilia bacterium]|nr:hypothetical protein [Thermoleophilia bacterium]